jgi:3'-phosphoadenosine 5'-phosphosulfate sulfotransferase
MTRPIVTEHNSTTGEYVEREMTDYEWEQTQLVAQRDAAKIQAEAEAETKREAALAKLAALGLEPDDLKALGL